MIMTDRWSWLGGALVGLSWLMIGYFLVQPDVTVASHLDPLIAMVGVSSGNLCGGYLLWSV